MYEGFCRIYERPRGKFDFWSLLENLRVRGLSLVCPESGRVTRISDIGEHVGDQIAASEREIGEVLEIQRSVTFQLWLYDSVDLTCGVTLVGNDLVVQEYFPSGPQGEEIRKIISVLCVRFLSRARQREGLALVIDLSGDSAANDWLSIALGFGQLAAEVPKVEVLGLGEASYREVPEKLPGYIREDFDGCAILRRVHDRAKAVVWARKASKGLRPEDLVRVLAGDLGSFGQLKTFPQAAIRQCAVEASPLAVSVNALRTVLRKLRGGNASPGQVKEWASFVRQGYVSQGKEILVPVDIIYETAAESQIMDVLFRLDMLCDEPNMKIIKEEVDEMLAELGE